MVAASDSHPGCFVGAAAEAAGDDFGARLLGVGLGDDPQRMNDLQSMNAGGYPFC
jgi:hypothetical protein